MKKLFLWLLTIYIAFPSMLISMAMPQMSPAEMQQMQQMEQQLMQEIDQYVGSLSPEEQAEFHRAVEEETKKIESMSPEDLNKYIQNTFSSVDPNLAKPIETKKPDVKKVEPKKEITPLVTEKQTNALSIIDSLIKHIESYILKLNAMPDLPTKLPKWARQGRIIGWKADMTFNSYKKELESLSQQLHKIKKLDEKTKKYIFLPDIMANEALINNLTKVNSNIIHWEPQIILRALEFETMNATSKKATIQTTNALLEGLTNLALAKALDDIIIKYDPEAKKLRDEADKAQKQALESSKRSAQPAATKSYGSDMRGKQTGPQPSNYGDGGYGRGYSGGYSPSNYGRGSGSYGRGAAPSRSSSGLQSGSQAGGSSSSRRSSGGIKASATTKNNQPIDKKGLPTTQADKNKDDKTKKQKLTDQEKARIELFSKSIEDMITKLMLAGLMQPAETFAKTPAEVKPELIAIANKATDALEEALVIIYRIATGASADNKKIYGSRLQDILDKNKKELSTLINQIKNIDESKLSKEQIYAYLGGKEDDKSKMPDDFKIKISKPFDLYKVAELLKDIQTAVNKLSAGHALPTRKTGSTATTV